MSFKPTQNAHTRPHQQKYLFPECDHHPPTKTFASMSLPLPACREKNKILKFPYIFDQRCHLNPHKTRIPGRTNRNICFQNAIIIHQRKHLPACPYLSLHVVKKIKSSNFLTFFTKDFI